MNNNFKSIYPNPRRDETVIDNYHGVEIKDPYRWLEDPDCEETKIFIQQQNAITKPFLENCLSRKDINARLTQLWNYPKYSCPYKYGDKYFFYMNSGLQNQSVLYIQNSLDSTPEIFLDPNKLCNDGTVSLKTTSFTEDGQILAYGLSCSGSDWFTVYFKHVEKGDVYSEKLEKVKFTKLSWTHDNEGIFYGCYYDQEGKIDGSETKQNKNHKLLYHFLGTPQSDDIVVVEFPNEPDFIIDSCVSDCGNYLVLTVQKAFKNNLVYFSDLKKIKGKICDKLDLIPVITKFEADYEYVTNTDSKFIFKTNKNAPNYSLIIIDFENPNIWETLIPNHETDVLEWTAAVNEDFLLICYIRDVKNVLELHDLKTGEFINSLPLDLGTISSFSGKRKHNDIYYQFTSILTPGIIYHCNLSESVIQPKIFRETKINNFDRTQFITKQVFYQSNDGCRIPLFIVHKKNLIRNGSNPCLLYGYGGFNISLLPTFSVTKLAFVDNLDGIYAVANIRGGGEYGEKWHKAGRVENKQNVFDDFQAAAEYLISEKYTNSGQLVINGGSNGGLLVAACANQRPDLFRAAIVNVGVLDMLRFHKFTIGYFWVTDYGSSDDKEQFEILLKYSPLHNIKIPKDELIQYPSTLLLTADHDDRVVPLHSLKFIATLQHTFRNVPQQTNPLLIKIDTKAGHGGGKPTTKMIEEWTDIFSFLVQTMNLKFRS